MTDIEDRTLNYVFRAHESTIQRPGFLSSPLRKRLSSEGLLTNLLPRVIPPPGASAGRGGEILGTSFGSHSFRGFLNVEL